MSDEPRAVTIRGTLLDLPWADIRPGDKIRVESNGEVYEVIVGEGPYRYPPQTDPDDFPAA